MLIMRIVILTIIIMIIIIIMIVIIIRPALRGRQRDLRAELRAEGRRPPVLGWHYLSNATGLMWPHVVHALFGSPSFAKIMITFEENLR